MNKRIRKKIEMKEAKKFISLVNKIPAETIKVGKDGRITNWNELSKANKRLDNQRIN